MRVVHYLRIASKMFLTAAHYLLYCFILFMFKRNRPLTIFAWNNRDNADLLTIDSSLHRVIL